MNNALAIRVPVDILTGFEFPITNLLYSLAKESTTPMPFFKKRPMRPKKRLKNRIKTKKKDPIFVDGKRPRPMYVDYKDVELLKKLISRHGRIVVRRKTGCSAVSQRAVTLAIKRARFMALLPFVGD
jgi:small subunit ribosomal protein S18